MLAHETVVVPESRSLDAEEDSGTLPGAAAVHAGSPNLLVHQLQRAQACESKCSRKSPRLQLLVRVFPGRQILRMCPGIGSRLGCGPEVVPSECCGRHRLAPYPPASPESFLPASSRVTGASNHDI